MRWFAWVASVVALAAFPLADARADCGPHGVELSPSPGHGASSSTVIRVGPDPVVFAFWRPDLEPTFEAVCEADERTLETRVEPLPSSDDEAVARVVVRTGDCAQFVLAARRSASARFADRRARYRVDPTTPSRARPAPFVTEAVRQNKRYGCGPSDHLGLQTNVRPAALRVEVEPLEHTIVVPLRTWDDDSAPEQTGEFWLGRTMCRGPNLPLADLDDPMSIRLTALYTDGTIDVGTWQRVEPQTEADRGRDEAVFAVQEPHPPPPSANIHGQQAAGLTPPHDARRWLWLLLSIPGALALGRALRRRRAEHREDSSRATLRG